MIGGVANLAATAIGQALVQLRAPEDQRGRVVGVYSMIGSGMRTGNGITIGWLGALLGVSGAVAVGGLALVVGALLIGALIALRFVVGLGLGAELPIASTLMSEFAPARIRGRIIVWLEAFWAGGWILAAVIGTFVATSGPAGWRWALALGMIPAARIPSYEVTLVALFVIVMYFVTSMDSAALATSIGIRRVPSGRASTRSTIWLTVCASMGRPVAGE